MNLNILFIFLQGYIQSLPPWVKPSHSATLNARKTKQSAIDQKEKWNIWHFFDGTSLCKIKSGWTSPGGPLDPHWERNVITVLGTKNAGKNEISESHLFHSYPYNLSIIHNLHLCVCIKDSKEEKTESWSGLRKREIGWKWDWEDCVNVVIKSYRNRRGEKWVGGREEEQ